MLNNTETTMAYEIESVKGNATVDSIEAAAEWIGEMQPAFVSVNGESVDYAIGDDDAAIAARIRAALTTDAGTTAQLKQYATETAADTGEDYATAVRMMGDEPGEVAEAIGCSVDEVTAFVRAGGTAHA